MITIGTYRQNRWLICLHGGGLYWHWSGALWKFKAPWEPALFSERYGYEKTVWRAFGWRFLKDPIDDGSASDTSAKDKAAQPFSG